MKYRTQFLLIACLATLSSAYPVEESSRYGDIHDDDISYTSVYGDKHDGLYKYGPAPLGPNGVVVDTPEVAHAKALHSEAYHNVHHGVNFVNYAPEYYDEYGPAPVGPDGRVVDTPEVAHAKAAHHDQYHAIAQEHKQYRQQRPEELPEVQAARDAHLRAYAAIAKAHHQYNPHAHVPLRDDGVYLQDTPEVEHARAQHLATKAAALRLYSYGAAYPYYDKQ